MRTWRLLFTFVTVVVFCLCSSSRVFAFELPVMDEPAQAAYARVSKAPLFAVGRIGIAAALSEEEKALTLLLQHKEAGEILEALLWDTHTTTEGKLYALLGLKTLQLRSAGWNRGATPSRSGSGKTIEKESAPKEVDVPAKTFTQNLKRFSLVFPEKSEDTALSIRGCLVFSKQVYTFADDIAKGMVSLPSPVTPQPTQQDKVVSFQRVPP